MREIIFAGNPNAGKSTLFNALAHAHAHTGNWHGVTVGASSKTVKNANGEFMYTDLPGIYSLRGYSLEEKHALSYLKEHSNALLVNVVDVRYLSRSLLLTADLIQSGAVVIVVLTMYQSFLKNGGKLDIPLLSKRLGVPVYAVNAFSNGDVIRFNAVLQTAGDLKPANPVSDFKNLSNGIFKPQIRKENLAEKICYNRILCLPLFFVLTATVFFLTFGRGMPGVICKELLETLICDNFSNWIAGYISTPAVRALVCDGFLRSAGGVFSFLPK